MKALLNCNTGQGGQRLIPISFNLSKPEIDNACLHLNCQKVLIFGDNYKHDETAQAKLIKVIKNGLPSLLLEDVESDQGDRPPQIVSDLSNKDDITGILKKHCLCIYHT